MKYRYSWTCLITKFIIKLTRLPRCCIIFNLRDREMLFLNIKNTLIFWLLYIKLHFKQIRNSCNSYGIYNCIFINCFINSSDFLFIFSSILSKNGWFISHFLIDSLRYSFILSIAKYRLKSGVVERFLFNEKYMIYQKHFLCQNSLYLICFTKTKINYTTLRSQMSLLNERKEDETRFRYTFALTLTY